MELNFPEGFLWGAATSSHQVEGGNHNDWSEWEKANAERLAKDAKEKWQVWQQEQFPAMFEPQNYISGQACDHYNRFREDFDIAKSLGHNSHRFSIEWSRVEPAEGKFDEKEIEHYRQVILALRERGLEPFVTLWHFTNPLWISKIGDWTNKKTIDYFIRYAQKMVQVFPEVKFWVTFNEPNIHAGYCYFRGSQPPGEKNIFKALRVFLNFLKAHKKFYGVIKAQRKDVQIGLVSSVIRFESAKNNLIPIFRVKLAEYFWNKYPFRKIIKTSDFLGLNYYTRKLVDQSSCSWQGKEISDLGWEIYPQGIYHILKSFAHFNLPIYITENGLADAADSRREKFIKDHLFFVHKAITEGVLVKGYFHWSFLEIFEFVEMRGFWPRFGLVKIDYKTQERKIRPSAWEYAKICKTNKIESF